MALTELLGWLSLVSGKRHHGLLRTLGQPMSNLAAAVRGERGGWPWGLSGKGGDVTEYLIAFNDEWVPDHTDEGLREKSSALRPLVAEMRPEF